VEGAFGIPKAVDGPSEFGGLGTQRARSFVKADLPLPGSGEGLLDVRTWELEEVQVEAFGLFEAEDSKEGWVGLQGTTFRI